MLKYFYYWVYASRLDVLLRLDLSFSMVCVGKTTLLLLVVGVLIFFIIEWCKNKSVFVILFQHFRKEDEKFERWDNKSTDFCYDLKLQYHVPRKMMSYVEAQPTATLSAEWKHSNQAQ